MDLKEIESEYFEMAKMQQRYIEMAEKLQEGFTTEQVARRYNTTIPAVRATYRTWATDLLKRKEFLSVDELKKKVAEYQEIKNQAARYKATSWKN